MLRSLKSSRHAMKRHRGSTMMRSKIPASSNKWMHQRPITGFLRWAKFQFRYWNALIESIVSLPLSYSSTFFLSNSYEFGAHKVQICPLLWHYCVTPCLIVTNCGRWRQLFALVCLNSSPCDQIIFLHFCEDLLTTCILIKSSLSCLYMCFIYSKETKIEDDYDVTTEELGTGVVLVLQMGCFFRNLFSKITMLCACCFLFCELWMTLYS